MLGASSQADLGRPSGTSYTDLCSPNRSDSHKAALAVKYILARIADEVDKILINQLGLYLADCNWYDLSEPASLREALEHTLRVRVVPASWQDEACIKALARLLAKQNASAPAFPRDIIDSREPVSAQYPIVWLDAAWRAQMPNSEFFTHIRRLLRTTKIEQQEFMDCVEVWGAGNKFYRAQAMQAWEEAKQPAKFTDRRTPTLNEVKALDDSRLALEQIDAAWRTTN